MELEFKRKNLPYLKQIVREVLYQEELSEIIVPDSLPDVGNIVESFAIPIIRGKESRNGSTAISGGIKGEVIYNPEDLSVPKTLDVYIPFNVKLDHPQLTEESRTLCSVQIRSVDCRILNSRKVLLRVNIACMLLALAHQEEVLFEPQAIPDDLQVKQVEYACKIPVEYAEKSFVVSDSLAIPSGSPPIDRVIRTACLLEVADSKSIANKGVFKGTVYCKVLYQSIDGQICSHEQKLPFSQFCEFGNEYDDCIVSVLPIATGCDFEVSQDDASHQIGITLHVLAQCLVHNVYNFCVIEDCYSINRLLEPEWKEYTLPFCLDRKKQLVSTQSHVSTEIHNLISAEMYMDFPNEHQTGDIHCTNIPVSVHLLGYDKDQTLISASSKLELQQEFALAEDAHCYSEAFAAAPCMAQIYSDGIDVRCEMMLDTVFLSGQPICGLSGGELKSDSTEQTKPSVIMKRVLPGSCIWDIAKECCAKTSDIRALNGLEQDYVPSETMLLIPVG